MQKRSRAGVQTAKDECEKTFPQKAKSEIYNPEGKPRMITDLYGSERERDGQVETVCSL